MTDEAKRILEQMQKCERASLPKSRGDIYKDELTEYIISKLQPYNVPYSAIGETLEYIMMKTHNFTFEELREYQRMVEREQRRGIKRMMEHTTERRKDGANND